MKHLRLLILTLTAVIAATANAQRHPGSDTVRLGIVLPLKEPTPRGAKMVEFYQGMLMAADSLKHEGLNIDIKALHSGTSANDIDHLLDANSLADRDIVFGSLDAAQLTALADYCDIHGVRLVVPFTPQAAPARYTPLYYLCTAPHDVQQRQAVWFLTEQFADCNIVTVECNDNNTDGKALTSLLRDEMAAKGIHVRNVNIDGDDLAMAQALNHQKRNIIVLNSPALKALTQLLPRLKAYRQTYPDVQLTLFGYPDWQTYTGQFLTDFYELDTYVYTTFYRNPLQPRSEHFDKEFLTWFHTPMAATFPRYAMMGFDLAYFFLRGYAIYGNQLEAHIHDVPARPYQHPLYFVQQGDGAGYVNEFVQLIHYTPYQSIELLTRNR